MMYRNHHRPIWILSLLTVAALAVVPARGEEAPGAFLVTPEPGAQETREAPDPSLVPEVLHLPGAEVAAAETLAALREQTPVPGVPYRNGFQRTASTRRVELETSPLAWVGRQTGQLHVRDGAADSWLGRFVVEGAHAFRVLLRDLELPAGSRIWLHAGGRQLGPFGRELLDPDGNLWLPPAPGPEVVVEIEIAAGSAKHPSTLSFTLGDVMEIVAAPRESGADRRVWTSCDIDAMCITTSHLPAIDILREATALLSYVKGGGSYLCTGGLMNDKDTSGVRPYLLTANHCFDTQSSASSLVAYFDYRTDSCNGTAPSIFDVPSVSGATLLASDPVSDFTFVELSDKPSGYSWYLGWTSADPAFGSDMYRVSHPAGTPQKYSASTLVGSSGIVCSGLPTSDFHYSDHDEGSTAGGSSGAPVTIDDDGVNRVVGQLLGVCHLSTWDDCSYSTYSAVDGAFSTTFPYVKHWLNDLTGCHDAYEPDDSAGAASPIAAGSAQTHSICPSGDEDWATFSLGATSAVQLETSGPSGDTRMWLYDAGLSQLEFDDDDGTGLFSRIDRTCGADALPAGTYYVKIDEFGDDDEIPGYDLGYDLLQTCGIACPTDLTLSNDTISGTASYRAGNSITLGPSLVVNGTSVDLIAGQRIVLGNGTRIGGSFSAATDPAACSL